MSYGIQVPNDYGTFIIDGTHRNMQLAVETSVSNGSATIGVNRKGIPIVAVKGGGGLLQRINMSGDLCVSITVYTLSYASRTTVRVFTFPELVQGESYGLNVHSPTGELAYTSNLAPMLVNSHFDVAVDYFGNPGSPAGWTKLYSVQPPAGAPTPITAYKYNTHSTGDWVVLGTVMAATGAFSEAYYGGPAPAAGASAIPVVGIDSAGYLRFDVDLALVLSVSNWNHGGYASFTLTFFEVTGSIITLDTSY